MSAPSNGRKLAGLSLDDILTTPPPATKEPPPAPAIPASISGRTLLDIIRDEEPKSYKALIGKKDHKKPWTSFKGRLHLKKPASSAASWSSSIKVPTSDVPLHYNSYRRHRQPRSNSVRYVTPDPQTMSDSGDSSSAPAAANRPCPSFTRRSSVRYNPPEDYDGSPRQLFEAGLGGEERLLSAREAVAAQQAAEAAAAAEEEEESDDENEEGECSSGGGGGGAGEAAPMKVSLMDLLEETDREMGLEGGRYIMDEEEEEEVAAEVEEVEGGEEHDCCVCMVKHTGSACSPCGHTFCRMCSRELKVQRGNCPLCNDYILEILDIF